MISSSSLKTADAACSSPIGYYYHHLQQYHNLLHQESLFQPPNSVSETELLYQDETGHVPVGCTFSPLFDKRKAMNLVTNSAEAVPKGQVPKKKKKKKTDNRSKIKTAQGLRDRRVRMSMGIAREFFDLQDLLGYDKPSKTLEWLLINSNKAILDLSAAASSSTSDQETILGKTPGHGSIINQAGQVSCSASLKSTTKQKAACLAKQSRDRARARARARTVAKLSIANLNHQKNRLLKISDGDMMCSDHQTYLRAKDHNFCSKSLMKSVVSGSHKQERATGEDCQQYAQNQQLQLQNYDYVIKSHDWNTSLNPILSLDHWNISCVYPHQGSSAAHQMNLSRDFNINGRPRGYTL